MNNYDKVLIPLALILLGIISLSGIETYGAATLEGAFWKQNVIYMTAIIFLMLPPAVQEMRFVWFVTGGILGFLIEFGGANVLGFVGKALLFGKAAMALLSIIMCYRMWLETWKTKKIYMIAPVLLVISVILLLPIQDENIFGSGFRALKELSLDRYRSDHGFHIYLGLVSIFAGISEFIIRRNISDERDVMSL
ncbi:MAG: hypothetical protein K2H72_04445 [Muribaculaceae bacterium]|nr:hypothetical protein [Muribaculaceae bacterium]